MPISSTIRRAAICLVSLLAVPMFVLAQSVTDTTFSTAVQLPGVRLPAGSYQFSVTRDGRTVRVSGTDGRTFGTFAVLPIRRSVPGEIVVMRPSVAGAPPEVSALYGRAGTTGVEFVYRRVPK